MTEYEYTKYCCNKETLRETIDKFGVAIIPNVLDEKECENIVNGLWDYFEHISQSWNIPLSRNNKDSLREFYKLFPLHSMLVQHWNVGHAQVSWDVRQNSKIIDIFAYFWGCTPEELLVSFDGVSFNPPPEFTNKGWNRNNTWYHTDQSYTRNDFECIQSWVTGLDVNDGDATLSIMEGSNRYHREFAEEYKKTDKEDWYRLTKEEEQFYINKGCSYKNIKCPKGSLVFWDSRTIHCGAEAYKTRSEPNFRSIVYVCYTPRKLCSKANLKKKQKAFDELRTTNHYPCKPKLFSKFPRTYGNEVPTITQINKPLLTELGKKLAGF